MAYSAFDSLLPDTVQVGGVRTPPDLRSRATGVRWSRHRCSRRAARAEGVERAIRFTARDNRPARRAYETLGFRAIGNYKLVMFAMPSG